jgi:hypothetical protein
MFSVVAGRTSAVIGRSARSREGTPAAALVCISNPTALVLDVLALGELVLVWVLALLFQAIP